MDFEVMLFNIIKEIIEEKVDIIDLAYNTPGGIEGWLQVEILKRLYDGNKALCSEITREKPYPRKNIFCDFYLKYNNGKAVWVELKADENNRINYAAALESDIQKMGSLDSKNTEKYAVLISKNSYIGSEISAFPVKKIKTSKGTYNVWIIECD